MYSILLFELCELCFEWETATKKWIEARQGDQVGVS